MFIGITQSAPKRRLLGGIAASVAALSGGGTTAFAQRTDDLVVMRRVISPPKGRSSPAVVAPSTPTVASGAWKVGDPTATPGCTATSPATASVTCVDASGRTLADASCTAPRPSGITTAPDYSRCSYAWINSAYGDYSPGCSNAASRMRTAQCRRSDGAIVTTGCSPDDIGARTVDGPVIYKGGCSYRVTAWTPDAPSSTCTANSTRQEAAATCERYGGDITPESVPVSNCSDSGVAITRTVQLGPDYSTCTYTPHYSNAYGECTRDPSTGNGVQSAPIVSCSRSDGSQVPVEQCGATRQTIPRACVVRNQTCGTPIESKRWDIKGSGTNYTTQAGYTLTVSGLHAERLAAGKKYCEEASPINTKHTKLMTCRQLEPGGTGVAATQVTVYLIWGDGTGIPTDITNDARFSYSTCFPN